MLNKNEFGLKLLKKLGIRPGQIVLDFGCGSGNYTIPAAKIVGNKGRIYAIDINSEKLDQLNERLKKEDLVNVRIMKQSKDVTTGLENDSVDTVLLYDVIHLVGKENTSNKKNRKKLYNEVHRTTKKHGLISVYPTHLETHTDVISIDEIKQEILNSGFSIEKTFTVKLIHDDHLELGTILNFRKA
ncbi:class I SAM-dependent methyltransferase [bacterium]|nr:class I SAM-dependent methyltransferase [bacterium]